MAIGRALKVDSQPAAKAARASAQRPGDRRTSARAPARPSQVPVARTQGSGAGGVRAGALLRSPGRALPSGVQKEQELALGHDLSDVRVHDDQMAADTAGALGAVAFTIGRDVFFGAGRYEPASAHGTRLIRHELVHAVQQRHARVSPVDRVPVARGLDSAERQARDVGNAERPPEGEIAAIGSEALVQFQEAPPAPPAEAPTQSAAAAIELLKLARRLALGSPPQEDRALTIVDDVHRFISDLLWGSRIEDATRGHSMNSTYARMLIGDAAGATTVIASMIRTGAHPSDGTWDYNIRRVEVAREYMEVVAGDRKAGESKLVGAVDTAVDWGLEAARITLELTPVLGSLIMFGEAVVGKSITGKDMSRGERAILGFGAPLAEVGTLIRVGNTAAAALRVAEISKLPTTEAMRMCFAARTLTDGERTVLVQLADKVKQGVPLVAKEQVLMNRLLGKLGEADRVLGVRNQIAAASGQATQAGRFTNLVTAAGKGEASQVAIGQMLARELGADVVRLAEDAAAAGAKNPDFLINNQVAELVELATEATGVAGVQSALNKIVSKHVQAGVVVADLTKSTVTSADLLGSVNRLWGNPRFLDVARLIVTRAGHVVAVLDRPISTLEPLAATGIKAAAEAGAAETH